MLRYFACELRNSLGKNVKQLEPELNQLRNQKGIISRPVSSQPAICKSKKRVEKTLLSYSDDCIYDQCGLPNIPFKPQPLPPGERLRVCEPYIPPPPPPPRIVPPKPLCGPRSRPDPVLRCRNLKKVFTKIDLILKDKYEYCCRMPCCPPRFKICNECKPQPPCNKDPIKPPCRLPFKQPEAECICRNGGKFIETRCKEAPTDSKFLAFEEPEVAFVYTRDPCTCKDKEAMEKSCKVIKELNELVMSNKRKREMEKKLGIKKSCLQEPKTRVTPYRKEKKKVEDRY